MICLKRQMHHAIWLKKKAEIAFIYIEKVKDTFIYVEEKCNGPLKFKKPLMMIFSNFGSLKMPDGTTYLPESFLPAAERYGLAVKIDHWVLKNTIKLIQDQHPHDHSRYSINISGHTVSDKEFLPYAIALLEESGIDPSAICFEITETAVISDLKAAEVLIDHLKAKGCLFALDDFGTGASSFTYLNALDLDYLKIDGSFVTNITHNEIEREILRAINKIGQLSGMKTIAEYLENKETLEILNEIGVDYAQGYYYGEPREADMK